MSTVEAPTTVALTELVEELREISHRELTPDATGEQASAVLARYLGNRNLLAPEHCEGSPDRYRQHVLHVEDDGSFSIVSLVWLPGQSTPIHDHVSWCVVGVHAGEETEIRYEVHAAGGSRYLTEEEHTINPEGSVCAVAPPGDIHAVRNSGTGKTISIHVYGADIARLGSSIRRTYELPVKGRDS